MYYLKIILRDIPAIALTLSKNTLNAVWLYMSLIFFLFRKKFLKSDEGSTFSFYWRQKEISFLLNLYEGSPDVAALREIFVDHEYQWPGELSPSLIVDLGAHTGNSAKYFHVLYPDAKIIAVEASKKNYDHLVENTKDCITVQPINVAVLESDRQVNFYENESSLGSSLLERGDSKSAVVEGLSLNSLYQRFSLQKADLVKIDIEGAEELLFKDSPPEDFAERYIIEVHEDLMTITKQDLLDKFKTFSLIKEVAISPQRSLCYLEVKL